MTQIQPKRTITNLKIFIILFINILLIVCVVALFPQVRRVIMDIAAQIYQREASMYQFWSRYFLSLAMGGVCVILFFDYCTLTASGRELVNKTRKEIIDCLSEIDFRSFIKPVLILLGVYLLGILTIIRANFLYVDDITRAVYGYKEWHTWSRYVSELLSYFVHPEANVMDNSPLTQLIAILILSISSLLLIYVIAGKKITTVHLIASASLGLSPYYLECLAFKFDSPYMALSILTCIFPFLFIARKKAFIFCSVLSLLIMCMTYQSASGIYLLIVIILSFQEWNNRKKTNKEILSFIGAAAFSFCIALLFFKFFLMKPIDLYVSNAMHPASNIISGALNNIKNYVIIIYNDFGIIWKICIIFVLLFFIIKSTFKSNQKRLLSFFVSILVICLSFISSYGIYLLLEVSLFSPRALIGFGAFLAIMCIYIVSDYKKIAVITALALNWCFFVFAFSYGNALADQNRYNNFRIGLLLHDLSTLHPNGDTEDMTIQVIDSIEYTPVIENIAKNYPVIKKLISINIEDNYFNYTYIFSYNNFGKLKYKVFSYEGNYEDFRKLDLPVVLDSYYHTIKSDGIRTLVELKK